MEYPVSIKVGESNFEIEYKKAMKATSSVRIKNGKVFVSISRYLIGRQRDETVEKFLNWAKKRLEKSGARDYVIPVYSDGSSIVTHNKIYELSVRKAAGDRNSAKLIDGSSIELKLKNIDDSSELKYLAEKVIMKDQAAYLDQTLAELNELYFKEEYKNVKFKRTSSRFGSCSSKRNINIALRLLFAPREVFRYVCVHELAHLKEMNHSKRFWKLVEEAMPEYRQQEKWLRENGFMLG